MLPPQLRPGCRNPHGSLWQKSAWRVPCSAASLRGGRPVAFLFASSCANNGFTQKGTQQLGWSTECGVSIGHQIAKPALR